MADEAKPYPKSSQLARGTRRYRRKVASAKGWQRIIAAKQGPCRVCRDPASNGSVHAHITFHHLVARAQGGDDVSDNIVPLCQGCHGLATLRNPLVLEVLARSLTDAEYAYIVGKLGESGMERLFGAGRS
jgi:5-methylcytosine-specific restriction endonuclease McrA